MVNIEFTFYFIHCAFCHSGRTKANPCVPNTLQSIYYKMDILSIYIYVCNGDWNSLFKSFIIFEMQSFICAFSLLLNILQIFH